MTLRILRDARAPRRRLRGAVVLVVIAVGAAVVPWPPTFVEHWYSRGLYPVLQRTLTALSDLMSFAALDIAVAVLFITLSASMVRVAREAGWKKMPATALVTLLRVLAVTYLLFLVLWGLNYRRVPLEEKLDFDRSRIGEPNAVALASQAVARVNALHEAAHGTTFDRSQLSRSFAAAERTLGGSGATRTGRPKQSLLGVYFRAAAIDGMTDPLFLEVILNPDLVPVEVPDVLAHEWSHLAGYADESEASFLAWLTCLRGDSLAQYSGWLSAYRRAANVLPRDVRERLPPLHEGPKADLRAIAARLARSSPLVRQAARGAYDSYLKANRIPEGIENYDAVIQLMLGTSLGREWSPVPPIR